MHLRKNKRCLVTTEGADLDATRPTRSAVGFTWAPAARSAGPMPFWATLQPPDLHQEPPRSLVRPVWPTPPPRAVLHKQPHLEVFVRQLVIFGLRSQPTFEEWPIGLLDKSVVDVVRCALAAADFVLARSAGSFKSGRWNCGVCHGRVFPDSKDQVTDLPTQWQICVQQTSR
ncbi:unnamed protein product [Symbiodinium sp. CCMP2592]|nr:unnamed protein product [Symbiodinium sp. CCMP2592]